MPFSQPPGAATPNETVGGIEYEAVLADSGAYQWRPVQQISIKTVEIETGYFTMAGSVKPAFLDTKSDAYRDLYGPLVHPIRLTDREFLPNVLVTGVSVGTGSGGADVISYIPLSESLYHTLTAHGLTGIVYLDEDGELTSDPPTDVFRRVEVGQVASPNQVVFNPAKSTEIAAPVTKNYPATVWSHFKEPSYSSATLLAGTAEVYRANSVINASPNSAAMLNALIDPENQDDLRFSGDCTGITIQFATKSYISDIVLQISRRLYWTTTLSGGGVRTNFDVLIYTNAADGSPAQTIKVWDTGEGTVVFNGLNEVIPVNAQCEKFTLQWTAVAGAVSVQGALQSLVVRGAKRKETITISPGNAHVPYDDWKLDSPLIRRSERIDTNERERSGIAEDTNLMYPPYGWGWGRAWNPGTDTGSTVDRTIIDRRSYRDWVYDGNFGKYDPDYQWLSIDHESSEWQYHPADTAQQIIDRDTSWKDTYDAIRALSPDQFAGPYLFPYTAFSAIQGYFNAADGAAHGYYANAKLRERNADALYELSDVMTPVAYRVTGESLEDWKANIQHRVDECHKRGKLCIPYVGALDYAAPGTYWGESDYREMLRFVLQEADGVMLWEQITAYETTGGVPSGTNPYTPTVIESICRVIREEVANVQRTVADSTWSHLDITAGDLTPNVEGYTSGSTNGSGDVLTDLVGGSIGQQFWLEIASGDGLQFGTGTVDAGTHGTPPANPLLGPAVIGLRYGSDNVWHRIVHQ